MLFMALFAVFATAVLGLATTTEQQRGSTESTSAIDSVAEGAAQFALADTGVQGCGVIGTGTMNFASGDRLSFSVPPGSCGSSTITAPGQNCGLCVLNYEGVSTPLSVQKGSWNVPGEVDVNGSIKVVKLTSGTRIGWFGSGTTCTATCTAPAKGGLPIKIGDPLQGALPVPTPSGSRPSESGNKVICPGTYSNLSASATTGDILFLAASGQHGCPAAGGPSLYDITGSVSITGNGSIVASGVTIYFGPSASLSTSGSGKGDFSIDCGGTPTSTTCGTADTPATGRYAGVAIFVDPANASTLSLQGNGNFTVAGTFEASHATLNMGGNGGTQSFQGGRLILSQLTGTGNGGAGLGFGGTITSDGCSYWNDGLTGTRAGGAAMTARVRFETACNSGGPASIVSFGFGNGP
jgi:hypothetical protein